MSGYNLRNPAVKRILQELKELQREDDPNLVAEAIEVNIFEWHFVVRGAWESEFEGGIYHGRIIMPAEYPFKPPAFVMLTPSGRFETGVKICLSISSHHPESWQPSWSVRSALVALIAFMQTPGNGALGSLDHPKEVRRQMAVESRTRPPAYGTPERQQLINAMHQRMLDCEDRSRQECQAPEPQAALEAPPAEAVAAPAEGAAAAAAAAPPAAAPPAAAGPSTAAEPPSTSPAPVSALAPGPSPAPATPAEPELRYRAAAVAAAAAAQPWPAAPPAVMQAMLVPGAVQHRSWEDRGLTYLAVVLALCIAALVIRKVLIAVSFRPSDDLYSFNHVEGLEL